MPNNDLISRKALQAAFENECVGECGCCKHVKHNPEGCALIVNAPAVDAEPVRHSEWVEEKDRVRHWHCRECGLVEGMAHYMMHFCPNCGANMEKEE